MNRQFTKEKNIYIYNKRKKLLKIKCSQAMQNKTMRNFFGRSESLKNIPSLLSYTVGGSVG